MIAVQSENGLSPKPQHTSRAPSPVPSAVYSTANESMNGSSPRLPLPQQPRRSSFSTEASTDVYEDKPLVTQRSYPHLKKQSKNKKQSRRGSDATTTTDDNMGSDGSLSIAATSTAGAESSIALPRLLANDKRNHDFHTLFRSVPDGERLIDDYGCALQKEILLQGRVYISEHHLCFNANIFGWITNLVIAFADIEDIEKRSTAIFIPNAILISTCSSKHFLASFLSRDQAYDQMVEIWKASRANSSTIEVHNNDKYNDDATAFSDDDESDLTSSSGYSYTDEEDEGDEQEDQVDANHINPNHIHDISGIQDRQSSLASLPLPKHISADEAARRRAVSEAGPRPNMQEYIKKSESATTGSSASPADSTTTAPVAAADTSTTENPTTENVQPQQQVKEKTDCECSKNAQHFPTVVMDNKYDTTIETMYNLLYDSPFMSKFLSDVEKSTEVCIGQWSKNSDGNVPYSRESSYIKYLGGSIGPKSTKCYLKEDVLHLDTSDYVCQLTVTQTPDVPSGGSFSVKTRTCISWCGQSQVRVLVTVLVDFTKSSWLKSTIEKASIDGQQNFYKSLDAAVRKYLDQHAGESIAITTTKKKGRRRHHYKHRGEKESQQLCPPPEVPKNHFIIDIFSSILNWFIENASVPNTSQLTAICMGMMVLTNMYIASKMAGFDKQLSQLGHQQHQQKQSEYYAHYDEQDNNSLWKLLSKLDPDARKEDLRFVQQTRQPLPSSVKYQNHNNNDDEVNVEFDENLEFSQMAKNKLDKQMMELEKMIQKAGQSMEQVTQVVQNQRKRILNPEWKR